MAMEFQVPPIIKFGCGLLPDVPDVLRRLDCRKPLIVTDPFLFKQGLAGTLTQHLDRSGNRVALALVTLGLYIAASLLMQHSLGPRLFGELPVLAALGYGLALWFTFRIARGISRAGRL